MYDQGPVIDYREGGGSYKTGISWVRSAQPPPVRVKLVSPPPPTPTPHTHFQYD